MTSRQIDVLRKITEERKDKLKKGDELPPGVIKLVKVYIAMKRKLSVGDKMAGRHGNKGVIARIVPEEDMPYLPDGTPVEIVLNPLGVPSRMNVGQILETHLGWASKELGRSLARLFRPEVKAEALRRWFREVFTDTAIWRSISALEDDELLELADSFREGIPMATPVFDGARETEIRHLLEVAGLPESGKIPLHDGMTGDEFGQEVTVGYIYMLKLSHSGGRQDSRSFHRPLFADHPAAAGRQGAIRRPAVRRNGSVGARSLRRRAHPAGVADGQIRRRIRPRQNLRSHRQGRTGHRARRARIVQRAGARVAIAVPGRGTDEAAEAATGSRRPNKRGFRS